MNKVLTSEKVPIKLWLNDLEDGALEQAKNLANLPFAYKHIAIMPDSHQGYGMPIGGVLATKGVVIPNSVGVDINCGVIAARTYFQITKDFTKEKITKILSIIRKAVPVGFYQHQSDFHQRFLPKIDFDFDSVVESQKEKAGKQLATLGGGNHFIELQRNTRTNELWIMIHSGSRNLGYTVANHYNKLAKEMNKKWFSSVNLKHDLAFLPLDSIEGKHYLAEMEYCGKFSSASRDQMLMQAFLAITESGIKGVEMDKPIDITHNYAAMESHFGQNVMVHRKGAIRMRTREIGIIPGSMGTKSYIVKGLGNPDSFCSASHGAGRNMSRTKAIKTLSLENEQTKMKDIIGAPRTAKELDEAPGAYKDIDIVMKNQKDLVEIIEELVPIAVIKG